MMLCLIVSVPLLSACQAKSVAQLTYEALRAEDCRRNELEDFCSRNYSFEYQEYRRVRQDFMNEPENLHLQNPFLLQVPGNEEASDKEILREVHDTQ